MRQKDIVEVIIEGTKNMEIHYLAQKESEAQEFHMSIIINLLMIRLAKIYKWLNQDYLVFKDKNTMQ